MNTWQEYKIVLADLWQRLIRRLHSVETRHVTILVYDLHFSESQAEARSLARGTNRLFIVQRGISRSVVFECPSGCGDILTINVDPKAGKAWRMRLKEGTLTLLPSVWRSTGCRSHFILWRNQVWWCGLDRASPWPREMDEELRTDSDAIRTEPRISEVYSE